MPRTLAGSYKSGAIVTMKTIITVLALILLTGCAYTINDPNGIVVSPEETSAMARSNLNKLEVGMTREQVLEIMGTMNHHYHRMHRKPTIIPHPYKTETMTKGDRNFLILYYYTGSRRDDLLPIVIEKNRVIGWGNSYLGDNVKRIQVDINP